MSIELTGSVNSLPAGVHVGEYSLQNVVGEGGFGIVYRAHDPSLDRVVAIKEYMPSTLASRGSSNQVHVRAQNKGAFDAGLRSFINEARLLAKFSHPALVHVYRFFEANGTAYMVMRHYEGQTFRAVLDEKSIAMNERWLSGMLSPVLDVLEMLHAADCFHRDISPDNILLDVSGMPVLLDFGAARRVIGDMTQALTMVLKPGFAPIEQYVDDGGMPQGAWTDVYQLGAMLYLAITGKPPATAVARMIQDSVGLLSAADYPGYSQKFLQGVHRALAVKPQDRPQSVAELRALLGIATFTVSNAPAWSASGAETTPKEGPRTGSHDPGVATAVRPPAPPAFDVDLKKPSGGPPSPDASSLSPDRGRAVDQALGAFWRRWRVGLVAFVMIAAIAWLAVSFRTHPIANDAAPDALPSAASSSSSVAPPSNADSGLDVGSAAGASLPPPAVDQSAASASGEASRDKGKVSQLPAEAAGSSANSPDKTERGAASSATDVKPEAPVKKGVVTLRVTPWGNVRVNRSLVGTTPPLIKLDLPEGSHQIEISNPASASKTFTVQVKSGDPVTVMHKFE